MTRNPVLYCLLFVAVVAVSFGAILIRLAGEAPALTIAAWRLAVATVILLPLALRKRVVSGMNRTERILSLTSGLFLALHFVFWVSSLRYTSIASSVVIVSTNPVFVGLGARLFFREHLSKFLMMGIALSVIGGAIIGWGDIRIGGEALYGDLLALGGAMMASSYLLVGRRVRSRTHLLNYIFVSYGAAAAVLLAAALLFDELLGGFSGMTYIYLVLLAVGPQLVGHTTLNWALRYLSVSVVAVVTLGEPIFSTVFAYLMFDEHLTLLKGLGALIILMGIYLSVREVGLVDSKGQ